MVEPRARKYHRDRVAETLREEISGMIVGELGDPRISSAYVSEVVLNPGGKSARVYISVDGGEVEEEKTVEALTAAGLPDARATAAHEDGRLIVTVTGADPGRIRDAVAGFALTVRSGPSPAAQTAANGPAEKGTRP